jgi:peptide-methionine (S)-S-oxide reductase
MKIFLFTYIFTLLSLPLISNSEVKNNPMIQESNLQTATFGAGCYWCVEAIFSRLEGVVKVTSGFSGGHVKNPSYKEVCTGNTGHAEVAQITFNPEVISFSELLKIFFKTHDPSTLNRQGGDVGTQYRSAIFYHSEEQKSMAQLAIQRLNDEHIWENPIVTEINPFDVFYPAEDYHQEYFKNNPNQGYCRMVIQPKVEKFEKLYQEKLK